MTWQTGTFVLCATTIGAFRSGQCLPVVPRNIPVWDLHLKKKAGTSCEGIVFTLPDATTRDDLIPLWEREMWTETYHPEWVMVETESGSLRALTFVVSTDHRQYAGDLPRGREGGLHREGIEIRHLL